MKYRPDIDGLRAVAVVPVVLFHAGAAAFGGGFVGVDVFFVISGFLITSIIVDDMERGRFSIVRFYERRVRRIFPALFAVVLGSYVLSALILLPNPFRDFSQSVVATALFSSNFLFWIESGYFDAAAHTKPLLHTWSLAVEEQFYIVFPVLLLALRRWLSGRWALVLVPAAVGSLALSVAGVAYAESAAFYLAPFRAWELLLGAGLALGFVAPPRRQGLREAAAALGLALIAYSVVAFSDETPFPGLHALVPCGGAALVIYAGQAGTSAVNRLLGLRPLVFVGLISYSLYLWHWPFIVFARSYAIDDVPGRAMAAIVALSFAAAVASWHFVERPFRGRQPVLQRPALFAGAAGVLSLAVAAGLAGHLSLGRLPPTPPAVAALADFRNSVNPRRDECNARAGNWIDPADACVYGAGGEARYAVWGDSHADALIHGIGEVASRHGESVEYYSYEACPSVVGIRTRRRLDHRCEEYNSSVLDHLVDSPAVETVFLISRHVLYLRGRSVDFGPAEARESSPLAADSTGTELDLAGRIDVYERGLRTVVDALASAGKSVVLVYPIPETGYPIPETLAKLALRGADPAAFRRPAEYFRERNDIVFELLDGLGSSGSIHRIYPHEYICDEHYCKVVEDGKALYADDDHLSRAGAGYLAPLFEPFFERRE